jgi:hypothetical protein
MHTNWCPIKPQVRITGPRKAQELLSLKKKVRGALEPQTEAMMEMMGRKQVRVVRMHRHDDRAIEPGTTTAKPFSDWKILITDIIWAL